MKSIINEAANPFTSQYKPQLDFDDIKPVLELTEEEQMNLAIQESLKSSNDGGFSQSPQFISSGSEVELFSSSDDMAMSEFSSQAMDDDESSIIEEPNNFKNEPIEMPMTDIKPKIDESKGFLPESEATCNLRVSKIINQLKLEIFK